MSASPIKRVLLGLGCAVLALLLVCGGAITGGLYLVVSEVQDIDAVRAVLAHAQADERVVDRLGAPIETRLFPRSISIKSSYGVDRADLDLRIKGPRGHADLVAEGVRERGDPGWTWHRCSVYVEGDEIRLPSERASAPLEIDAGYEDR